MKLIIAHDKERLEKLDLDINTLQKTIQEQLTELQVNTVMSNLNETLKRLETIITKTKKTKFARDTNDYLMNKVYTWRTSTDRGFHKNYRKKGKMGFNRNKSVSFSSSGGETTNYSSDPSEEESNILELNNEAAASRSTRDC